MYKISQKIIYLKILENVLQLDFCKLSAWKYDIHVRPLESET